MKNLFQELVLNPVLHSLEAFAERDAFCIAGEYYTYRQFGESIQAKRIGYKMLKDSIVALEIRDDLETYASIFALWLEGKAYVPNHPEERNRMILDQISGSDNPFPDSLAYILFTSGSTGTPKGVAISRKNVGAFMDSFWKMGITVDENDRCLQCFDLTFDVSVQSFLAALTRGACVYTVPYGQVKYLHVASLIHESHITFGAMAPSMLVFLRPYFEELDASSLKTCILTAEACPADLIEEWQRCARNAEIYDFYGPTEATVYCTAYLCPRNTPVLSVNGVVSIGKPLSNVTAIILDDDGKIVDVPEEKGELCVARDQVTQGYWNNPEKNASSFSMIEYEGKILRFYHTGDLCYRDSAENLMYLGRIDQQAKIQGFRVELSEIEYHVRAFYQNAYRVVAIAFQNDRNITEIALFVECPDCSSEALLEYLRSKMPSYMIPSRIIFLEDIPLNSNDKIDRNRLKSML